LSADNRHRQSSVERAGSLLRRLHPQVQSPQQLVHGIHVAAICLHASTYSNEDVTISETVAHDNLSDPHYTEKHSGSGILLGNVSGGRIEQCIAYGNGASNGSRAGGPVGIWAHDADRVVTTRCVSYRNRTGSRHDEGGFDFDGGVSNSVMENNVSFENDGPGYHVWNYAYAPHSVGNITVRYNRSVGDTRR
jgi:hypothetical protein